MELISEAWHFLPPSLATPLLVFMRRDRYAVTGFSLVPGAKLKKTARKIKSKFNYHFFSPAISKPFNYNFFYSS